jgi:hypothetical protein
VNDGPEGCISDIDGKFSVRSASPVRKLKASYIGYEPLDFVPQGNGKDLVIRMHKTAYELSEVVIKPGINPANRIIREVIANRYINDHEHMPSFAYTSYDKMVFGPETQADADGLRRMVAARIDPTGMVSFIDKFTAKDKDAAPPQWLSTHPASQDRANTLRYAAAAHAGPWNSLPVDWAAVKASVPVAPKGK